MRTLQTQLTRAFKAPAPRQPDTHRKAREWAKPVAKEYGIEREGSHLIVWPPKGLTGPDPYEGDHYADDWSDAAVMVKEYAHLMGSTK